MFAESEFEADRFFFEKSLNYLKKYFQSDHFFTVFGCDCIIHKQHKKTYLVIKILLVTVITFSHEFLIEGSNKTESLKRGHNDCYRLISNDFRLN